MADIITSVVAHCRADATLIGATCVGAATRIRPEQTAGGTLPELGITLEGGGDSDSALAMPHVEFVAEAATRAKVVAIHARLRTLFHAQAGQTIASAGNALRVVRSVRLGYPVISKRTDDGAWEGAATYEFEIAES